MRSFAEENQKGTIEFLATKPLTDLTDSIGKILCEFDSWCYLHCCPTLIYYYSIYNLGSPPGNLDSGGILGSYIGLSFLAAVFVQLLECGLRASRIIRL